MVHLGLLEGAGPDRGCPVVMDALGHSPCPIRCHLGDDLDEGGGDMVKGVVIVVEDDDSPVGVVLKGGG